MHILRNKFYLPVMSGLASASAWADLLIFSDLLPTNLDFLQGCLRNPQPALPSLAFVAHLEGCTVDKVGNLSSLTILFFTYPMLKFVPRVMPPL